MTIEDLKKALSETNAISLGKSSQPEKVALKNQLFEATSWCPEDYSIATRIFVVMNDLEEVPKCVCGNECVPNKLNNKLGFSKFCGPECSAKNRRTPSQLFDKEWLHQKRISEKLSYQAIGEILGVSDVMVGKWCRRHDIEEVKYSWADSATREDFEGRTEARVRTMIGNVAYDSLYSFDALKKFYEIDGLSVVEIAEKFGVTDHAVRTAASMVGYEFLRKANHKSKGETELAEFVASLVDIETSFRPNGYRTNEIDIYIPSLNIGIEYNGCYYHSELFRDTNYHKEKIEYFREFGIRVVMIWSDDWEFNKDRVKRFITNLVGARKSIGARETVAVEISQKEYSDFLEENHLLGSSVASVRIGLKKDDEIVAVMGFKKIASNVNKIGWDLSRFSNTNVVGGFTKMLKFFQKSNPGNVYSFADLDIVDPKSNVYTKNGFLEYSVQRPDYTYYNPKTRTRRHKFNYRKSFFSKIGIDTSEKEEHQLCNEYGLLRCYDSGKICYVLE